MGLICTNLANYGAPPCMYIYMYIYICIYIYHLAKIPSGAPLKIVLSWENNWVILGVLTVRPF